ncbi:MAG: 2'-deoxycytidine 5'-triphosphate deaminase [Candidatus Paceibacterota bacterium]
MQALNKKLGALPSQQIRNLIEAGCIKGSKEENVKPSSLDLTLSEEVYEVEGVFLPESGEKVRDLLSRIKSKKHKISDPMLKNKVYMVKLNEYLNLPKSVYGYCNPKSTSGRIDVHVRLLADGVPRYDSVFPGGYKGELWISILPKTFNIKIFEGISFNQIRFFNADTRLGDLELELINKKYKLAFDLKGKQIKNIDNLMRDHDGSLLLTIDLSQKLLGYEAKQTDKILDLSKINFYDWKDFFTPILRNGEYIYLKQNSFYILSTAESIRIPPNFACEMASMDDRNGDFRSHYAGFLDPGWGWGEEGEGKGRPFTLEVRPFENLAVRNSQPIAKIRFEKLAEEPEQIYDAISSNYLVQTGPKLAKHFK